MTRWWWVRHGPTHVKTMVGWSDVAADLSDHAQIARLAKYLPQDALVVSSDLWRARATADILQGRRQRLADQAELREIHFGDWELRSFAEIEAEDPTRIRAYWENPGDIRAPGGESWQDVVTRVNHCVDTISRDHAGRDIIAVAHFGAILTQVQRALEISAYTAFGHRLENLSVTRIDWLDGDLHAGVINHNP